MLSAGRQQLDEYGRICRGQKPLRNDLSDKTKGDLKMSELIKIENKEISGEKINTVDARELHEFLGSKRQFSNWIKHRTKQYDFKQHVDFISINDRVYSPPRIEYFVSLDMAKELAMVEKTDKGREARKYFIECEKNLKETAVKAIDTDEEVLAKHDCNKAIDTYGQGRVYERGGYLGKENLTAAAHRSMQSSTRRDLYVL